MGLFHQSVKAAGAVEQRILGVQMEVNKVRMRHDASLPLNCDREQDADVHTREMDRVRENRDWPMDYRANGIPYLGDGVPR
jgi:hypothetical protein